MTVAPDPPALSDAHPDRLVRSLVTGVGLQVASVALIFLQTIFLARVMGVEPFGEYILVLAGTMIANILVTAGLPTFLTRGLASARARGRMGEIDARLRFARRFGAASFALVVGSAVAALTLVDPDWATPRLIGVLAAYICTKVVTDVAAGILMGLGHAVRGQVCDLVLVHGPGLLLVVVMVWGAGVAPTIPMVFLALTVGLAFAATVAVIWVRSALRAHPVVRASRVETAWIGQCIALGSVNGLAVLRSNLVLLALGAVATPHLVAIFRVAERVAALGEMVLRALRKILAPRIAHAWASDILEKSEDVLRKSARVNLLFTTIFGLLCLMIGTTMIHLAFGEGFLDATLPLVVLVMGLAGAAAFGMNGMVLTMTGHERTLCVGLALMVPVQVGAAAIGAATTGVPGAAIAVAVSDICLAAFLWHLTRRATGLNVASLAGGARP